MSSSTRQTTCPLDVVSIAKHLHRLEMFPVYPDMWITQNTGRFECYVNYSEGQYTARRNNKRWKTVYSGPSLTQALKALEFYRP